MSEHILGNACNVLLYGKGCYLSLRCIQAVCIDFHSVSELCTVADISTVFSTSIYKLSHLDQACLVGEECECECLTFVFRCVQDIHTIVSTHTTLFKDSGPYCHYCCIKDEQLACDFCLQLYVSEFL